MVAPAWLFEEAASALLPDPELTVSESADRNRVLSTTESPEAGPWRTSRVPYLREIMDCLSLSSPVRRVAVMKGAQVGASEAMLNWSLYVMKYAPGPMLIVQPTVDSAERFSRQRVANMIVNSEALRTRVNPPRSKDGGNTLLSKEFPGGMLLLAGANSASGLRSMPIRYLGMDERSAYPADVDGQGDPGELAEQRTANFKRRGKTFILSTPTIHLICPMEREFEESDQRRYWVPCQDCGSYQVMKWAQVQWPEGAPEDAGYICEHCGVIWDDVARNRSVQHGQWRASRPFRGTAGFHLPTLLSPWVRLGELAAKFDSSRKAPEKLKAFVNNNLAETWKERADEVDPAGLLSRREPYEAEPLPEGVVLLTAGIDVQDDRLEVEVVGWGRDEENWSIDYVVIPGEPALPAIWDDLDTLLLRRWRHPVGDTFPIFTACIDSGGHHTQAVYAFAEKRRGRRIWAVKGIAGEGRKIFDRPKQSKAQGKMFPLGVDTAKTRIYARLLIAPDEEEKDLAGFCHFPARYGKDYFDQLTSEKVVTKYVNGRPKRLWILPPNRANEALDCRVYNVAALESVVGVVSLNSLATRMEERLKEPKDKPPPKPQPKRRNWVTGY